MLKQRLLTILFLAPLLFAAIFFLPVWGFVLLAVAIFSWGGWEWLHLCGVQALWQKIASLVIFWGCLFLAHKFSFQILILSLVWWLIALYFVLHYSVFNRLWQQHLCLKLLIGLLFLVPAWVAINILRIEPQGSLLVFIALVLVWMTDIGAYVFGKIWGKHKLAPHISPGKTIEGLIGGTVATLVIAMVMGWFMFASTEKWLKFILLTLVVSLVSVLGDLFESMVKRQSGAKDSGFGLPGHGGILDRLDSLAAAVPIFTIGWLLLKL